MLTRRAVIAGSLTLGLLASAALTRGEVEPLTLYEKTARAPLVVRARALSDSTRRPRMRVLEVLRGGYQAGSLVIAPHSQDNGGSTPWLKREVFRNGEESILFLTPYVDEFGRDEGPHTFALLNADQGKVVVPAEGGEALLEAVKRFAAILSLGQHDRQAEALRALLTQENPYLVEAALSECRKFRLAEPADAGALLKLLESHRPDFRAGALALLGQILNDAPGAGTRQELTGRARVFERVAAVARLDDDETVRREAIQPLEAFGDASALALIESIGKADASQSVRYAAQVAAYQLREKLR